MVANYHDGGRFPQALVLFGSRGTGKTTIARILSKALNCRAPQDGEPCDECDSCLAVNSGRSSGVTEMDMASKGSVQDIRELKQAAAFALVEEWRVYLMDEVHSASREAFDAMLKLVEEPPPKTLFILVTTEPDQIPETILSRAMPFEFRRLSVEVITDRLRHVARLHAEDQRVEDDVYRLLALRARGGMRDAIMSLEQLCHRQGHVDVALVRETFGITDLAERLLDSAFKGDLRRGLQVMTEAMDSAVPPVPLLEQILDGLTALLSAAAGAPAHATDVVSPEFVQLYAATPHQTILSGMRLLWDARSRMTPGSVTAPATLSVVYALLVQALAPSTFAMPATLPSPVAPPVSGVSLPSSASVNGTRPLRSASPEALASLFALERPASVDDLSD